MLQNHELGDKIIVLDWNSLVDKASATLKYRCNEDRDKGRHGLREGEACNKS